MELLVRCAVVSCKVGMWVTASGHRCQRDQQGNQQPLSSELGRQEHQYPKHQGHHLTLASQRGHKEHQNTMAFQRFAFELEVI